MTTDARPEPAAGSTLDFEFDGRPVSVADVGGSLLEVLREQLGVRSAKDGCAPQGQCGCCTVLVDGAPRVACVTPARRVAGRAVTTVEGLAPEVRDAWAEACWATGASQCGFCTPGIVVRLEAERAKDRPDPERALLAHLCRCTGWRTILDAYEAVTQADSLVDSLAGSPVGSPVGSGVGVVLAAQVTVGARDEQAAARRAAIEGRAPQTVGPLVALGRAPFADDGAPRDALVAVPDGAGGWAVAETLTEARRLAGKVQGRRTTLAATAPIELPPGDWPVVLQTSWVEPAYLETDASWCTPGGTPVSPLGSGGAFGGKVDSPVAAVARELADRHGRPVRVLLSREDTVRLGPKRPPLAAGVDPATGRIVVRVARTPGIVDRLRAAVADLLDAGEATLEVTEVDVVGPRTSIELRAAGWAEGIALRAALLGRLDPVRHPEGALARAEVRADGTIAAQVAAGAPLDEVVLRSYCIGAAHMAASWVTSESLTLDEAGEPADLTIRSFGVLRAVDTPPIEVTVDAADGPPVNGSDAVFAAVAAAVWSAQGFPGTWPTGRPLR